MNEKYQVMDPSTFKIDLSYQREPDPAWVNKIAKEWSDEKANIVRLSSRPDGYYVIDGNHTRLACASRGGTEIICRIHENLTVQDEAKLFAELNSSQRKPSFNQLLKAKAAAGVEPEFSYLQLLNDVGVPYTLSKGSSGLLACHSALLSIYKTTTQTVMSRALRVACRAANEREDFFKVGFFPGICSLVVLHTNVDDVRLVQVIKRTTSSKVVEIADKYKRDSITGGGSGRTTHFRKAYIELYNLRLKSNRIMED